MARYVEVTSFCLALLLGLFSSVLAAPTADDPCAAIAGQTFVVPAKALACLKSFPFNETLRQNVLQTVSRVFDFYTFEDFYLNSPPPFQESTANIRAELARINVTEYETDFDFNKDLYDFVTQLNDGHTRWLPSCYTAFQNILPAPITILEEDNAQSVFVAPNSVQLFSLIGSDFTDFFDSINFDWKRLAGAEVLEIQSINGSMISVLDYVDYIASTVSGNYLDHNVRVNSVFSSYRIVDTGFSQRVGDLAGPPMPTQDNLTFSLIVANGTDIETITVPYLAMFLSNPFSDRASFWANNCAANNATNGVDIKSQRILTDAIRRNGRPMPKASIIDIAPANAFDLPPQFQPTLPQVNSSAGVIKSYILPDNETGVMFVGSFEGDFVQFQTDTVSAMDAFKAAGVSRLLIDLTNNGGGFVCLGQFLHQFLAGSQIGYPGFQSSIRANTLAQKIVENDIALNVTQLFYSPVDWAFFNDTQFPETNNYINPSVPFEINGVSDPTSQRFHDTCTPFDVPIPETPPIPLKKLTSSVSNGNCASTCAMFSTLMNERHNTTIAVFGGKPGQNIEFKGMAGNQVLEWTDIDTEIKSANLKDDPLAPPDLIVNQFRHNWRTAWSFFDESKPIAYVSELPKLRFAYTKDTFANPQNLWIFACVSNIRVYRSIPDTEFSFHRLQREQSI
ncbi:hypothetical protein DFH11DRAFT_1511719 [Phellopilus nigrolimitatus]|nr:hypothetical protein DFH11DRAFT_1511719 [Phellopilus nigrolimitatus]